MKINSVYKVGVMPKLVTHTSGPQSVASTEKHISHKKPLAPSFSFQFSQHCNAAAAAEAVLLLSVA